MLPFCLHERSLAGRTERIWKMERMKGKWQKTKVGIIVFSLANIQPNCFRMFYFQQCYDTENCSFRIQVWRYMVYLNLIHSFRTGFFFSFRGWFGQWGQSNCWYCMFIQAQWYKLKHLYYAKVLNNARIACNGTIFSNKCTSQYISQNFHRSIGQCS